MYLYFFKNSKNVASVISSFFKSLFRELNQDKKRIFILGYSMNCVWIYY